MNRGVEEQSSPDSENAADLPRNGVELGKRDKERSHGKRRTAREIASMFEQLKQKHLLRKKEWAEEKETLIKRLQMAEESKNVLSELKEILENLREELRLEERKRLQMELDHLSERKNWEIERTDFLKKIEESAQESDRDGKDLRKMSEKILEQANEINELQGTEIELKRQMLEKDKQFLHYKRDLHHQFEAERATWKMKVQELNKKIRQMSNGKSSTSSLSPSPGDVQNPPRDFIETRDTTYDNLSINRPTGGDEEKASSYSNFERKVSDALRHIEKIRSDFHEYREESESLQTKSSDFKTSASPSPILDSATKMSASKVPWRTKQHSSISNQQHLEQETTARPSPENYHSHSSGDATLSLSSISNMQKVTPIPERKFKKLDGQDPNMRTGQLAGSPAATYQEYVYLGEVDAEKTTETSLTQSGIESPLDGKETSLMDSLDDGSGENEAMERSAKDYLKSSPATTINSINDKSAVLRSTSPKLPKLHQQLLFKRDPTRQQRALSAETLANSDFVSTNGCTYSDKILQARPTMDHTSTHTPYFDPSTGYAKTGKLRNDNMGHPRPSSSSSAVNEGFKSKHSSNNEKLPESVSKTEIRKDKSVGDTGRAATKAPHDVSVGCVTEAPAVHPKPKVSIHKDQDGNIIHVSPAIEKRSKSRENITPEKQYSIAERMGKAGRDWIRKKLHFKDKILDENEDIGQRALDRKKGKHKHRRQSSLLKSKRESTSVTTSDESSDGESRKRESLVRRNRRKGKSNPSDSPAKPKKYTRSKTDGSPKEMKKFLSKFKSSQSTSKKPSVVRKFERQLRENDIWTLKEEDGIIDMCDGANRTPKLRKHYTLDREVGNLARMKDKEALHAQAGAPHRSGDNISVDKLHADKIYDCSNNTTISHASKLPSDSATDASNQKTSRDDQSVTYVDGLNSSDDDSCGKKERLTVSRLVNRFSAHFDDENGDSRTSPLRSSMRMTGDTNISRSRSLTIHDGIPKTSHFSKTARRESDQVNYDALRTDGSTWHDRIIAPTESGDDNVDIAAKSKSSRKKFQSLSNFWEDKHSNENDINEVVKPRKTKFMSNEMKQKTSMLENVLSKGPKKARKYRRADTQPVVWKHDSEDETSTESEELDVAREMISMRRGNTGMPEEFCDEIAENMHETIPSVTGKFDKPSKPGRLPSRWAR